MDGKSYLEPIPGNSPHVNGATFRAVAVPTDPALLAPAYAVKTEKASGTVFELPIVFSLILIAALAYLGLRRRPTRRNQ